LLGLALGELYTDLDLLDNMVRALGRKGALDPKALAKEVGRSEQAVLEQLTQSLYFQPAATAGKLGRYELSSKGIEQFDKID
jgi:hypothetical protein